MCNYMKGYIQQTILMISTRVVSFLLVIMQLSCGDAQQASGGQKIFAANDERIRYTGRVDFTDASKPRFWQPGVYVEWMFEGDDCDIILEDEELWGNSHNYIEVIVDGKEQRLQTKSTRDTLSIARGLGSGTHKATLVKNTEAGIGYLGLIGIRCRSLVQLPPPPERKIEFIGNSITCGMGSDESEIVCDKGVWYDQHNAYMSYGAITARALDAQYHLSAVSGIGLIRSCCEMEILMPWVFDKINMREDSIRWDFNRYRPDVVTVCLGQNDGIQDSVSFCNNYIKFLKTIRHHYPDAAIVCLSSPMADEKLLPVMKRYLTAITELASQTDANVYTYFFSRRYDNGCGQHPSLADHQDIAAELTSFLKKIMK